MPCKCGKIITSKKNKTIKSDDAIKIVKKGIPSCDDECPPTTCLSCPTTCKAFNLSLDLSFNYLPIGAVVPLGGEVPTFSLSLELLSPNNLRYYYRQDLYPPFYVDAGGFFSGYEFEFQQTNNSQFSACGECLRFNLTEGDIQFFSLEKTMDLLVPNRNDRKEDLDYKDALRNALLYFYLNIEKNYLNYYKGKKSCNNTSVPWEGYFRLVKKVESPTETFSEDTIDLSSLTVGNNITIKVETGKDFLPNDEIFVIASFGDFFRGTIVSYNGVTGDMEINILEIRGSNTYSFWIVNKSGIYYIPFQVVPSSAFSITQTFQTAFYKDIFLSIMDSPVNVESIFKKMCCRRYRCTREYAQSGTSYPPPFQNVDFNPFVEPESDPTNNFFRIMNMVVGLVNYLFLISEKYLLGKDIGLPKVILDQYLNENRARYYYNSYFQTLISRNKELGFNDDINVSNGSGTYIRIRGAPDNNYF